MPSVESMYHVEEHQHVSMLEHPSMALSWEAVAVAASFWRELGGRSERRFNSFCLHCHHHLPSNPILQRNYGSNMCGTGIAACWSLQVETHGGGQLFNKPGMDNMAPQHG